MKSSRYVRSPAPSSGLVVQKRDLESLQAVMHHRYARAEELHELLYAGVTLRIAQVRLRKLWQHGLLDRYYRPHLMNGIDRLPPDLATPTYVLAKRGAELLSEKLGTPLADILVGGPEGAVGAARLEHDLTVTQALISLAVGCRERNDVALAESLAEWALWRKLRASTGAVHGQKAIVPDGAFTLAYGGVSPARLTFYLEVVHADVRGGNGHLIEKLHRYVEALHEGYFRRAYGHDHLRAVLIATTSNARAENLRQLAQGLTHGRRLFWFGSYRKPADDGLLGTRFKGGAILSLPWKTVGGEDVCLDRAGGGERRL